MLASWPLVLNFSTSVMGGPNPDHSQSLWNLWWVKWSVLDRPGDPLFTDWLYYPSGVNLALHTLGLVQSLYALPITALWGVVVAYNFVILSCLTLNAYAVYKICYFELQGRTGPALAAGAAFLWWPFVTRQASDTMHILAFWPFAFFWLELLKLYRQCLAGSPVKWGRIAGVLAGWLIIIFNSSLYLFSYTPLLMLFYAGLLAWQVWRQAWTDKQRLNWRQVGRFAGVLTLAGLGAAVALSPLLYNIWQAETSGLFSTDKEAAYIYSHSLELSQLWQPQSDTLLSRLSRAGPSSASYPANYLGWLVLPLILLGLVRLGRQRQQRANGGWLGLGLLTFILALGPKLRWDGPLPLNSTSQLLQQSQSQPWLPYNWLQKLPLLNLDRTPVNYLWLFGVVWLVALGAGMAEVSEQRWFAGTGTGPKSGRGQRWRKLGLVGAGLVVILFDWATPGVGLEPIQIPPVYATLTGWESDSAVMDLPFNSNDEQAMLYQTAHHHPILEAYLSRPLAADPYLAEDSPLRLFRLATQQPHSVSFPDFDPTPAATTQRTLTLLHQNNIGLIALHKTSTLLSDPAASLSYLTRVLGVKPFWQDPQLALFEVPALNGGVSSESPTFVIGPGWYTPETANKTTSRWMGQDSQLYVFVADDTKAALKCNLKLQATAFGHAFEVVPTLNGQQLTHFTVGSPQSFSLTLPLRAGRNELDLHTLQPAVRPSDLSASNTDKREITINWRQVELGECRY